MDDTTMYITEIFLNWFYRLITYVKLLNFILDNVKKMDPLLKCVNALNLFFTKSITVTFPFPNTLCLISWSNCWPSWNIYAVSLVISVQQLLSLSYNVKSYQDI
jgi:hypothetical protein